MLGRQAPPILGSPGDPTTRKNDPRFGVGIRPQNGGRFSDQISQKIAVRVLEKLWVKGRLATLKLGAFFSADVTEIQLRILGTPVAKLAA